MSKKHFIALADAIKTHNRYCSDNQFTQEQLIVLASFCYEQNENFDSKRWLGYIADENGPSGGKK